MQWESKISRSTFVMQFAAFTASHVSELLQVHDAMPHCKVIPSTLHPFPNLIVRGIIHRTVDVGDIVVVVGPPHPSVLVVPLPSSILIERRWWNPGPRRLIVWTIRPPRWWSCRWLWNRWWLRRSLRHHCVGGLHVMRCDACCFWRCPWHSDDFIMVCRFTKSSISPEQRIWITCRSRSRQECFERRVSLFDSSPICVSVRCIGWLCSGVLQLLLCCSATIIKLSVHLINNGIDRFVGIKHDDPIIVVAECHNRNFQEASFVNCYHELSHKHHLLMPKDHPRIVSHFLRKDWINPSSSLMHRSKSVGQGSSVLCEITLKMGPDRLLVVTRFVLDVEDEVWQRGQSRLCPIRIFRLQSKLRHMCYQFWTDEAHSNILVCWRCLCDPSLVWWSAPLEIGFLSAQGPARDKNPTTSDP